MGGFRIGAGRPKGSKDTRPRAPRASTKAAATPRPDKPAPAMSGTQWLRFVVNDASAEPHRRDRAAAVLAGIENRTRLQPGKREAAQAASADAGKGTPWEAWLDIRDARAPSPPKPTASDDARQARWAEILGTSEHHPPDDE